MDSVSLVKHAHWPDVPRLSQGMMLLAWAKSMRHFNGKLTQALTRNQSIIRCLDVWLWPEPRACAAASPWVDGWMEWFGSWSGCVRSR
jgi:hypothetical protein